MSQSRSPSWGTGIVHFSAVFAASWALMFPPMDYGKVGGAVGGAIFLVFVLSRVRMTRLQFVVVSSMVASFAIAQMIGVHISGGDFGEIYRVVRAGVLVSIALALMNIKDEYFHYKTFAYFVCVMLVAVLANIAWWAVHDQHSLPGQNQIGVGVSFGFALSLILGLRNRAWYFVSAVFVVGGLLSWSKGAWLSIIYCSFILMLWIVSKSGGRAFLWACSVLMISGLTYLFFGDYLSWLVSTEFSASEGSRSNLQRYLTIVAGLITVVEFPLGVGAGYEVATSIIDRQYGVGVPWIQPDSHNAFLMAFHSGGLFFGFFFAGIVFFPLLMVFFGRRVGVRWMTAMLAGVFFVCGNLTGVVYSQAFAWIIAGSLWGVVRWSDGKKLPHQWI